MDIKTLLKYWIIFISVVVTFDVPFELGGYGILVNKADLNYMVSFAAIAAGVLVNVIVISFDNNL